MTVIAALVQDGVVCMGADRCVSDDYSRNVLGTSKIVRKGPFLIGVAGDVRMLNIIRYRFVPPLQNAEQQDDHYIATDFMDALRDLCTEEQYSRTEDGQESQDSTLLVAYHGRLYTIGGLFEMTEFARPFAAIGSGRAYVLGSLHSTEIQEQTAIRITKALYAAAEFDHYVRGPFDVEVMNDSATGQ